MIHLSVLQRRQLFLNLDSSNKLFMGLRRNNKEEKRKRNRAYARQFQLAVSVVNSFLVNRFLEYYFNTPLCLFSL